ncbi:MAG: hypothetical protein ACYTBX_14615 [Planctomycetota bacterium]|jgi:hypothetical protein
MLKRKIIVQILIVLLIQCILGTTTLGDLITMTNAEQQVRGKIGYMSGGSDILIEEQLDPDPDPQGLGSADLGVSFADNGVSLSDSLTTVFSGDEVTGNGLAFASAVWGSQPGGADDVHGGGGSGFALYFTRESSPAYFYVGGQIDIDVENDPDHNPEEVVVYVRLSSDDGGGMTAIWEEATDGGSGDISIPVAHGLWLDAGKTYLLEAYAESGTGASVDYPGFKSRTATFSFTTTVTEGEPAAIDIVPDTISTRTKSITCYIWPPDGYDVTEIDPESILLEGSISPVRTSLRRKKQMLVVKFPTSELSLTPTPERVLTVTGELTDGTEFEDSDTVEVVKRGGKPS